MKKPRPRRSSALFFVAKVFPPSDALGIDVLLGIVPVNSARVCSRIWFQALVAFIWFPGEGGDSLQQYRDPFLVKYCLPSP
jgi:hypothetical protein